MIRDNLEGRNLKHGTATAEDILSGKVAYSAEGRLEGTMPNNGTKNITLDTTATYYTIPKGYHSGQGKVGIIKQSKTITPQGTAQTKKADNGKVLESVTIEAVSKDAGIGKTCYDQGVTNGDTDGYNQGLNDTMKGTALPADVLETKTFTNSSAIEVVGTMKNNGKVDITLTPSIVSYTVPQGYHNGQGTVKIVPQNVILTPTGTSQTINPDTNKVIGKVQVNKVTKDEGIGKTLYDEGYDVGDTDGFNRARNTAMKGTATPDKVLINKTFTNSSTIGAVGTMSNIGNQTAAPERGTVTISKGYHNGNGYVDGANAYNKGYSDGTAEGTQGTANKEQVLIGKTFSSKYGVNIAGTMPDHSGEIIEYAPTYGTLIQGATGQYYTNDKVTIPDGYHDGNSKINVHPYIPHFKLVGTLTPSEEFFTEIKAIEVMPPFPTLEFGREARFFGRTMQEYQEYMNTVKYRPYFLPSTYFEELSKNIYTTNANGGQELTDVYKEFFTAFGFWEDWEEKIEFYAPEDQPEYGIYVHDQWVENKREQLNNSLNLNSRPVYFNGFKKDRVYYIVDNIVESDIIKNYNINDSESIINDSDSKYKPDFPHNFFYKGNNTEYFSASSDYFQSYAQDILPYQHSATPMLPYIKGKEVPQFCSSMIVGYYGDKIDSFNLIEKEAKKYIVGYTEVPIIIGNKEVERRIPIYEDALMIIPKKIDIYELAPEGELEMSEPSPRY